MGSSPACARLSAALACTLLVLVPTACSAGRTATPRVRVQIEMHDFGIVATPTVLKAGLVTLHIENRGPSTHELILDRSVVASESLPLLPNTLQVNEDGTQLTPVTSLNSIPVNSSHDLTVRITPGFYVLFCNLEGHYLGGMRTSLVVKE